MNNTLTLNQIKETNKILNNIDIKEMMRRRKRMNQILEDWQPCGDCEIDPDPYNTGDSPDQIIPCSNCQAWLDKKEKAMCMESQLEALSRAHYILDDLAPDPDLAYLEKHIRHTQETINMLFQYFEYEQ